jgi:hypothetical protein
MKYDDFCIELSCHTGYHGGTDIVFDKKGKIVCPHSCADTKNKKCCYECNKPLLTCHHEKSEQNYFKYICLSGDIEKWRKQLKRNIV